MTAAVVQAGVAHLRELVIPQFPSGAAAGINIPPVYAISQEAVPDRLRTDNSAMTQSAVDGVAFETWKDWPPRSC